MKWKSKIQTLAVAVVTGLLFQACVKEDLSNCPIVIIPPPQDEPTLKVIFTHRQTDITISPADLHRAVVYLFDSDNTMFATWQVDNPVFDTEYDTGLRPDRDRFGLVAWINPEQPYTISPMYGAGFQSGVNLNDARLSLPVPSNGNFTGQMPRLLFGKVDRVPEQYGAAPVEIPLVLDNYIINLRAVGLPPQAGTYAFLIHEDDSVYNFNNDKASSTPFYYKSTTDFTPPAGAVESTVDLSLTMLRLYEQSNATISLWNETSATVLYPRQAGDPAGLIELIKKALPNNDFAATHIYNIVLDFASEPDPPRPPDPPKPDPQPVVGTVTVYVNGMLVERENHALVE